MEDAKGPSVGAITKRHKQELKDFEQRKKKAIAALKRLEGAEKKTAKDALEREEHELHERHRAELEGAKHQKAPPAATAAPEADAPPAAGAGKRSAADKRREKKERAEREAQEAVERFAAASTQGGPRVKEMAAIEAQLQGLQLAVREMPADGSCLFEAVADQLTLHALPPHAARELRTLAAQWMRNHPEDYCAFLETDSGEPMGPSQFDAYCTTMATSNEWGGQMELVALCHALHVRICIHSAGPEVMLDAAGGPLLHVTFHRHYLASGAHYNSAGPPVAEVPWIRQ